jgi:hypothetical protein
MKCYACCPESRRRECCGNFSVPTLIRKKRNFLHMYCEEIHLVIYKEAVSHIWLCNCSTPKFLIYEENLIFFYISAGNTGECVANAVESVHGCYSRSALTLTAGTVHNVRLPPSAGQHWVSRQARSRKVRVETLLLFASLGPHTCPPHVLHSAHRHSITKTNQTFE